VPPLAPHVRKHQASYTSRATESDSHHPRYSAKRSLQLPRKTIYFLALYQRGHRGPIKIPQYINFLRFLCGVFPDGDESTTGSHACSFVYYCYHRPQSQYIDIHFLVASIYCMSSIGRQINRAQEGRCASYLVSTRTRVALVLYAIGNDSVPKITINNTINLFFFKLQSAFR